MAVFDVGGAGCLVEGPPPGGTGARPAVGRGGDVSGNPHNPGGRGLGELPRVVLERRVLDAEARVAALEAELAAERAARRETMVAFRRLSALYRTRA